jgi:hypothetical protein
MCSVFDVVLIYILSLAIYFGLFLLALYLKNKFKNSIGLLLFLNLVKERIFGVVLYY